MRTLEFQRQRLEKEIMASKQGIRTIRESDFPDVNALNQLHDAIERNMQLIGMIDQHLDAQSSQSHRASL